MISAREVGEGGLDVGEVERDRVEVDARVVDRLRIDELRIDELLVDGYFGAAHIVDRLHRADCTPAARGVDAGGVQ